MIHIPEIRKWPSGFGYMHLPGRQELMDRLHAALPFELALRITRYLDQDQWLAAAAQEGYKVP